MAHLTDQTPVHVRFAAMDDATLAARWVDELVALVARYADFETTEFFRAALLVVQRRLTPVCEAGGAGEAQGTGEAKQARKRGRVGKEGKGAT